MFGHLKERLCLFVYMCVWTHTWRLEGNLNFKRECHPSVREGLSLAWNSLIRLGDSDSGPHALEASAWYTEESQASSWAFWLSLSEESSLGPLAGLSFCPVEICDIMDFFGLQQSPVLATRWFLTCHGTCILYHNIPSAPVLSPSHLRNPLLPDSSLVILWTESEPHSLLWNCKYFLTYNSQIFTFKEMTLGWVEKSPFFLTLK